MPIIEVENLKKSYGNLKAVKGIDFYVENGSLFAFLGTNGAGKSTTIEILCTLLKADGGKVIIDGLQAEKNSSAIRQKIGVVFQNSVLDPLLTVRENLTIRGGFYGMRGDKMKQAILTAAEKTDLTDYLNQPYGKLSGGQRRRADIARALLHTPKILFLDEPTTGLDPKSKETIWQTIDNLQKQTGMAVFLTTHYMEEAAASDFITVIHRGNIAAKGTPNALKVRYTADRLLLQTKNRNTVFEMLMHTAQKITETGDIISVELENSLSAIPLLQALHPHITSFEVLHGSMEDVFLNIVQEAAENA